MVPTLETYTHLHRKEYLRTEIQGRPFQTCWTQADGWVQKVFDLLWNVTAQVRNQCMKKLIYTDLFLLTTDENG